MARTEKESLIQDAVGLIVLGQCGSTPEVENRLAHCDGFGMVDDKSHRTADEGQRNNAGTAAKETHLREPL